METEIAHLPRAVGLGEVPESNDREILTSPAALCQLTNGEGKSAGQWYVQTWKAKDLHSKKLK